MQAVTTNGTFVNPTPNELSIIEEKKMATGLHGFVGSRLSRYLWNHVDEDELGYVFDASVTYDFKDGQSKREPDVSYISIDKLAVPPDEDITVAPDIAAEVVSKNDKLIEVKRKVRQYQQAGVRLIWVLNPDDHSVDVYSLEKGIKSESLVEEDELDGGDVLPSFRLPVHKLFPRKA